MATVIRPPLVHRFPARAVAQFFINPVNLNLLGKDQFFGPPGMGPDYDYPNPQRFPDRVTNRSWWNPLSLLLLNKDVQFAAAGQGKSYDYPNPQLFQDRVANRTWVNTLSLLLLGKDVQFGAAGQGKSYDYPNPELPIFHTANRTWLQSTPIHTLVVLPSPFFQTDWPNPRIVERTALRRRVQLSQLIYLGQDTQFGAPGQGQAYDYPNPVRPGIRVENLSWIQSTSLVTLGASPSPFFQTEWPNPVKFGDRVANRTHVHTVSLLLKDTQFGAVGQGQSYDYPNPRLPIFHTASRSWLQSTFISLYPIQDKPFSQFSWPNPTTIYQAANRSPVESTPVFMFPAAVITALTCGCNPYGDGSKYGDGELYCDSTFNRKIYLVSRDVLFHNLSFRLQAVGRFVIDSINGLMNIRATRPFHYQIDANQSSFKTLSLRFQATGCMKIDQITPIVKIRKQQPVA